MSRSHSIAEANSTIAVLSHDVFDELLRNDLADNSVSFTVYLINPKIAPSTKYTYRTSNSSCYSSLLLSYTPDMQYMLLDLTSASSQYGSFIPGVGFRMVQYPRLLLHTEEKPILNPSFIPEIAFFLHQSVMAYLFPSLHASFLESELASQPIDASWDFGKVMIEVVTVVQELRDNTIETFLTSSEANRTAFWKGVSKQFGSILLTEKQISIDTRYVAVSSTPALSFLLTESMTVSGAKNSSRRDDLSTVLDSRKLFELLEEHKSEVFSELGFDKLQQEAEKETVGKVTIIPVFL